MAGRLTAVGADDGLLVVGKGVRGGTVGADVGLPDGSKKVIGESLGEFVGSEDALVGGVVGSADSEDDKGELVGSEVIGSSSLVITFLCDGDVVGSE